MNAEQLIVELINLKNEMLSTEEMYSKLGIDKERSYTILKSFGPRYLDSKTVNRRLWRENNPTYGYCHRMTGMAFRKFEQQKDLVVMKIHNADYYHFFMILCEEDKNYLIDLTKDQLEDETIKYPYELGQIVSHLTLKNFRNELSSGPLNKFILNFFEKYNVG